jgi:WD40 repeat protein
MKKYKFLKTLKGHTNTIKSSTISEDGRIIVSGSYDKSIRMWDVTSGENISILKNHNGIVN